MSGRRIAILTAVAATVAILFAAVSSGGESTARDPAASTRNGDPRGLLAAFRYLEARGVAVDRLDAELAGGAQAAVLVLPAPSRRPLDEAAVAAALQSARSGGVLVVLLPPDARRAQPALVEALGITVRAERPPLGEAPSLLGREPSLDVRPASAAAAGDPLLHGAGRLLAAPARAVDLEGGEVLARVGGDGAPVILRRAEAGGLVYVLADASLLENHRLDLADNLHLLEGLAALARERGGPILFDESHHRRPLPGERTPSTTAAGWRAMALQIVLATAVLMLATGRRFRPIRPLQVDTRRSTLEYVGNLAALYRRAGSEAELCREVERDLRVRLFERHGVPTTLDDAEAARRLAAKTGAAPDGLLETLAIVRAEPADLKAATVAVADLEARLEGRAVA
jgi:hypothetical protein